MRHEYVEKSREGDHICYISGLSHMRDHYPAWNVTKGLDDIFLEILRAVSEKGKRIDTIANPEAGLGN